MTFPTQILLVGLGFCALLFSLTFVLPDRPEPEFTSKIVSDKLIIIEDGGRAKVITIDGVEYILVTTYHGIGICKK